MIGKYLTGEGIWIAALTLSSVLYGMVGLILLISSRSRQSVRIFLLGALCWPAAGVLSWFLADSLAGLVAGMIGGGVVFAIGLAGLRKAGQMTESNIHG